MGVLGRISRHSISLADQQITSKISMSSIIYQASEFNTASARYTVVKRRSVVISEDTPPCCPDLSDSENGSKRPQDGLDIFTDDMDMADLGDLNMDFSCDVTNFSETQQCNEHSKIGTDEDFGFGQWSAVPDLHSSTLISGRNTGTFDLPLFSENFSLLGEEANETTTSMLRKPTDEYFDLEGSNDLSSSFSYQQSQDTTNDPMHPSLDRHHGHDRSGNAYGSMNSVTDLESQHQLQGYANSSSPPTPTTQTTIKLDNPEPHTVAAIMNILINSKAKCKFETQ